MTSLPEGDSLPEVTDCASELDAMAALIGDGGVVLYPTLTLWGIGGDARIEGVVERIQEIKGRVGENPFLVLVNSVSGVRELVSELPRTAVKLMGELWPGELTLLLPAADHIPRSLVGPEGLVGVRLATHPVPYGLLQRTDAWLVSTSANRTGHSVPTNFDDLDADIVSQVDGTVNHPPPPHGIHSTVVSVDLQGRAELVREGVIARRIINSILDGALRG
ncbi:MAG TPA: threonylcarbamoyl-AMP synthase [Myxococcales bacterium]|nr:threonylcarbamoyl-AMP synthase [Myxococcales bacterium]